MGKRHAWVLLGLILIFYGLLDTGGFLYMPHPYEITDITAKFEPITVYDESDYPTEIYNSGIIELSQRPGHQITYYYVWTGTGHESGIDEEKVRILLDENKNFEGVQLSLHYRWTEVYEYEMEGSHVKGLHFSYPYHTPYFEIGELISISTWGIGKVLAVIFLGMIAIYKGGIIRVPERLKVK